MNSKLLVSAATIMGLAGWVAVTHFQVQAKQAEVVRAAKLSPEEAVAFRYCASDMANKRISVKGGAGGLSDSVVPDEVCACHAKTMASVFKPGAYSEHGRVVANMVNHVVATIDPATLRQPADPKAQFARLELSLKTCAADYAAKQNAQGQAMKAQTDRDRGAQKMAYDRAMSNSGATASAK